MTKTAGTLCLAALVAAVLFAGCVPGDRTATVDAPSTALETAAPKPPPAPADAAGYRKPSDAELRARLTPLQYQVTQEEATEPPFRNKYWNNKRAGIYVDVVSGEPLFSSRDKYESGTGWPSFTRPLVDENIVIREDFHLGYARQELRSALGDSHLGHVFPDGPPPTGMRYCINSASLRFVPEEDLEKEGYGKYKAAAP